MHLWNISFGYSWSGPLQAALSAWLKARAMDPSTRTFQKCNDHNIWGRRLPLWKFPFSSMYSKAFINSANLFDESNTWYQILLMWVLFTNLCLNLPFFLFVPQTRGLGPKRAHTSEKESPQSRKDKPTQVERVASPGIDPWVAKWQIGCQKSNP